MTGARRFWELSESVHAVVYFHPTALAALTDVGLRGFWRGYFAQRAAPLGAIGEGPVRASFFGFSVAMTGRALPAVWDLASPEAVLEARRVGAGRAVAESFGGDVAGLADDLWAVVAGMPCDGRVLAAANAALPRPDDPFERLWLATTVLREHRGDGHVAALLTAGLTGLESLVLRSSFDLERSVLQPARGWTDDEWSAAAEALAKRGLVRDGRISDAGRRLLDEVERITDVLAWDGWTRAGGTADVVERLHGPAVACRAVLPEVNPIGLGKLD